MARSAVPCTFSQTGPSPPAVAVRLAPTLGSTNSAMRCPTKITGLRRVQNNQLAATQSEPKCLLLLVEHRAAADRELIDLAESDAVSDEDQGSIGTHRKRGLRGKHWHSISLLGRLSNLGQYRHAPVAWRLQNTVCIGQLRGAGCFGTQVAKAPRPCHAQRQYLRCAVLPNPSLKRSANGSARWSSSAGPAAHFALAAQPALPLSPA